MVALPQNANQKAAEAIKSQEAIIKQKQQHLLLVAIAHILNVCLLSSGYIVGVLLWRMRYKQKRISPTTWATLFVVWGMGGLLMSLYLVEQGVIPTGGGVWLIVPPLCAPVIAEYVRLIVWGLQKMAPETLTEQLARLEKKYGDSERSQSNQAGKLNPDTTRETDEIYLGGQLRSDQFPKELGILTKRGLVGFEKRILFQNFLIVGAVGSGKTTLLLRMIQQILTTTDLDVYVIDGKGDEDFALTLVNLIYQTRHESTPIFRIGKGDENSGAIYNPFSGSTEAIFNRLCNFAHAPEQSGNATYYAERNKDLLHFICYAPQGAPRSFSDLRQRLSKAWLYSAYEKDKASLQEIKDISQKAIDEFVMTFRSKVKTFEPITGAEGFTIEDTRHAVFSLATSSAGTNTKDFVNMLIDDIKDAMVNRIKRPCVWIVDEFLVLGNDSVRDILTIGRSFGMGVILAMQSIDAVDEPRTRNLMLTNCRTKIIMGNDMPETLIQVGGTRKVFESSIQHEEGASTGMGSSRLQDQYLIDPNEVRALHTGECFLLRQQKTAKIKVSPIGQVKHTKEAELKIAKIKPDPDTAKPKKKPDEGLRI